MIKATNCDTCLPAKIVFGRALQHFYNTAKKRIFDNLGIIDRDWRRTEVFWVITVPSIWGARAKAFMKEAAIEVGILSSQ